MDPRPPRMPWLSPYIAVRNAERAIDFYSKAFGFKSKSEKDENGNIKHAGIIYKNTYLLMLSPEGVWGGPAKSPATTNVTPPQTFYVYVDNVDKFYEKAIANGARSLMAPEDCFWGDRMCSVADVDGFVWAFARTIKKPKSSTKKKKATKAKKRTTKAKGTKKVTKKKTKKTTKRPVKKEKLNLGKKLKP